MKLKEREKDLQERFDTLDSRVQNYFHCANLMPHNVRPIPKTLERKHYQEYEAHKKEIVKLFGVGSRATFNRREYEDAMDYLIGVLGI